MKRVWGSAGATYTVHEKNDDYAIVEIDYPCPYCGERTGKIMTVYSDAFDMLETGEFCEECSCGYCGEDAMVFPVEG